MLAPAQEDVRGALAADVLGALVAERAPVDALEERLAPPEQHRPDGEMQLGDQSRLQILPHSRYPAAQAYVLAVGRGLRLLERRLDAVGDEVKHGAALHLQRRAPVMRQDEHRRVVRRLLAPPAAPVVVGPRPAHRAEHVAAEDPRADTAKALLRHLMVRPGLAARLSLHLAPEPGVDEPLHHFRAVHAERVLQTLVGTGAETVER